MIFPSLEMQTKEPVELFGWVYQQVDTRDMNDNVLTADLKANGNI